MQSNTMKQKDIASLRTKSVAELTKRATELNVQMAKLKGEMTLRRLKNVNAVKNLKRELAVVMTIKNQLLVKGK